MTILEEKNRNIIPDNGILQWSNFPLLLGQLILLMIQNIILTVSILILKKEKYKQNIKLQMPSRVNSLDVNSYCICVTGRITSWSHSHVLISAANKLP